MRNIDLGKIKKEYLILICAVLFVSIAFFFYKNVFSPLQNKIKRVCAQVEQKKRDIQKAELNPRILEELEDELAKIQMQIDFYQDKLQAQADMPQILKELNQITGRLDIKIVSVNPLEKREAPLPDGKESIVQIPIRIKLQCGYHQLGIFINQIENSPRFMKITELKINADSKNVWRQEVELVIASYRLVAN